MAWTAPIVAVACGVTSVAEAAPQRDGFTGDLGIGPSLMVITRTPDVVCAPGGCPDFDFETASEAGLAGLSLSLGGFVSHKVAVLFRASSTSYFEDGDQFTQAFYGPVVEVWPQDIFFVGGGLGLGVFGPNPFFSRSSREPRTGFALDARAGLAVFNGQHHACTLSLEATQGFYEDERVLGLGFLVAWKWY